LNSKFALLNLKLNPCLKINFSITVITLFLTGIIVFAYTTVSSEINPPSEVRAKLTTLYPDAIAIQWESERGKYEAEFTVNGLDVEITIDNKGNVVELEEEIRYAMIPENIRIAIEKDKKSYKITKAMKLMNNGETQYSLIALLPGSREHFLFSEKGVIISHKVMAKDKAIRQNVSAGTEGAVSSGKWDLPVILSEISGIALVNSNIMACVQDELGSIFLYDLRKNIIVSEIEFAGAGDYEGIAIVKTDAYVLRSDGMLYEISNFQDKSKKVSEYKLKLPKLIQNFEGLCYDVKSNRLLIAPRTFDSDNTSMKGIYAFNLSDKRFSDKLIYSIDLTNPVFDAVKKTGKKEAFIPSEIAIHPVNGDIYISDARNKQLLLTNKNGEIKKLFTLNKNTFPKTEGIAIANDGNIYFSNEGKKSSPNIVKMQTDKLR